jgi:DNA polymerase
MSALSELSNEILKCERCPALVRNRTKVVPGEGAENAEVMFIGEGPGWHEDQQGRPFVGPAGMFLNELIQSVGWQREQVYIANVIKCRPPQNRDPLPDEIAACHDWLDRQIALIKPKMIVTLGRFSMARYFPGKSISKIHGTSLVKDGIIYFAMYHPAAALHQQKLRQTIMEDMLKIPPLLKTPGESPPAAEPPSKQLNMFEV